MKAIRINKHGGPEALEYEDVPDPRPAAGQALVRLEAAGLNFADTLVRRGLYPSSPPMTPGIEGAGVVEAVGEGVEEVRPGDRVAYTGSLGAYAELAAVPAWMLVPLPEGLDTTTAAAAINQARTAHYLTHDACPLQPGQRVLVHAGAGGVGMHLVQMAKRLGAYVYSTVSTPEKAEFVRGLGADEVILYSQVDFEEAIKESTGGRGVDAVYDAVAGDVFLKSINCLARRGHLCNYGLSSGSTPPIDIGTLRHHGSVHISTHTSVDYHRTREEVLARSNEIFGWLQDGSLKVRIFKEYPLADAAQAHRDIEGRGTIGKLVLKP